MSNGDDMYWPLAFAYEKCYQSQLMCQGSDIKEAKASSLLQDSDLPNIDFMHIGISNQRVPVNMWPFLFEFWHDIVMFSAA
jgi:hypothetical protein